MMWQWSRQDPRRHALIDRRPRSADDVAAWVQEVHESDRSGPCGPGQDAPRADLSTRSTRSTGFGPPTCGEIAANGALALTAPAGTLLGRQLEAQAESFEREGGFTDGLYRVRRSRRLEK